MIGVQTLTTPIAAKTPIRQTRPWRRALLLKIAFGLKNQPAGAEQPISKQQGYAGQ